MGWLDEKRERRDRSGLPGDEPGLLTKEKLGEIVPFLEDVLRDQYGKAFHGRLG
jgi:hypothetical protein